MRSVINKSLIALFLAVALTTILTLVPLGNTPKVVYGTGGGTGIVDVACPNIRNDNYIPTNSGYPFTDTFYKLTTDICDYPQSRNYSYDLGAFAEDLAVWFIVFYIGIEVLSFFKKQKKIYRTKK